MYVQIEDGFIYIMNYLARPHFNSVFDLRINKQRPVCKEQQMFKKKPPNYFTYKIKYHMYNQLFIKKIYLYYTQFINTFIT